MPEATAPVAGVPYAKVPGPLSASYGFLNSCAVHFCSSMKVVLGNGEKKPVVVFVASDAIYTGDEGGKLYRRIPLESIRALVTNCDSASVAALKNRQIPFTLFLLQVKAPDLLLLGPESYAAAICVGRIMATRGVSMRMLKRPLPSPGDLPKGTMRLSANIADVPQPARSGVPRRDPAAPAAPKGPDVPDAHNRPKGPDAPDAHNRPKGPDAPDVPTAAKRPKGPDVPDAHNRPKGPDAPDVPTAAKRPKGPDAPDVPTAAKRPKGPDVPDAHNRPKGPDAPDAHNRPKGPDAPDAHNRPKGPDAPDAHNRPKGPDAPDVPTAAKRPKGPDAPDVPTAAKRPKGPDVPDAHNRPKGPDAPDVPTAAKRPKGPDAPDVPTAAKRPKGPDVPDAHNRPKGPDAPDAHNRPKGPDAPDAHNRPKGPDAPDAHNRPKGPDAPDVPTAAKRPKGPDAPDVPTAAKRPKGPDVPDAHNRPKGPDAPDVPTAAKRPKGPDAPDVPTAAKRPKGPDVPDAHNRPKGPDAPDAHNRPKGPDAPDAHNRPKGPDAPDAPTAAKRPKGPDAPDAHNRPKGPDAPDAPTAAKRPKGPDAPDVPDAPRRPPNTSRITSEGAKGDGVKRNIAQVKVSRANSAEAKKQAGNVSAPVLVTSPTKTEDKTIHHSSKSKPPHIPSDIPSGAAAQECETGQGDRYAQQQDGTVKDALSLIVPSEAAPLSDLLVNDAGDADKYLCYDEEINAVFAVFPMDAAMRADFPRASSASAALYYVVGVFHLEATSDGPPHFLRAVLYVTRTHLYIARSDTYVLRCCALSLLESVVTGSGASTASGIALPGYGLSFAILHFTALPDVCVAFATESHTHALLKTLRQLSCGKSWPHVRDDALQLCDLRLPLQGQRDIPMPIPERPRLPAARNEQKGMDYSKGTLHTRILPDAREEFVAGLARVVDAERRTAFEASASDAYVPFALRQQFPPFRDVRLCWGGEVLLFTDTQKGLPSAAVQAHLFVSATQIVVVDKGTLLRVMPLAGIGTILVRTIDVEKKKRLIAFVSRAKDVDVCVLVTGRESDTLLRQAHEALRAADPTRVPPIVCSTGAADEKKLRICPDKKYVPPKVELPLTSEAVRYRNYVFSKVTDVLRRCAPNSVHNATSLTEQYFGRELELLNLLYSVYPEYASMQEKEQQQQEQQQQHQQQRKQKQGHRKDGEKPLGPSEFRARLTAFCKQYIPDSVGVVGDALRCYAGKEEELMRLLVQRYGPEPHTLQNIPEPYATNLSDAAVRSRLLHFYRAHEPKKIADIESIMQRYKGREGLLFETLEKLYGGLHSSTTQESDSYPLSAGAKLSRKDPRSGKRKEEEEEKQKEEEDEDNADVTDQPTHRERLDVFFARYAPARAGEAEALLGAYAGREDILLSGFVAKYGPEPVPCTRRNRARLAAFFTRAGLSVPDEETLNSVLRDFRGSEVDFFHHMEQRFGAEHSLQFASAPEDVTAATFAKVDPLTALPFVDVPPELRSLFPSLALGRAALLWFGRALHWEQPNAPEVRSVYVTNGHVFVGSGEADMARCAALERLEEIFINAKRDRTDTQACLLLRLSGEHDLFLALSSDKEARELLDVLVAALTHYHFGRRCRVFSVRSLADPGIDANCRRPLDFVHHIAAVPLRPRQGEHSAVYGAKEINNKRKDSGYARCSWGDNDNNKYVGEEIGIGAEEEHMRAEREMCTLRSRLHDSLVQQDGQQQNILEQDAALLNSGWDTIRRIAARQRNAFGTTPKRVLESTAPPLRLSVQSNFTAVADVPNRMDKLNPFQRAQFKRFSMNGTYGLGTVPAHSVYDD